MKDIISKIHQYLNDLEENEGRLNGNMDLFIDYFHDANELLVELTTLIPKCSVDGVVLNVGQYSVMELNEFIEDGCLTLSIGEHIEYEDPETGELKDLTITELREDFMLLDEYAMDGSIISECEMPYTAYLYQLQENGALDAYPKVVLD